MKPEKYYTVPEAAEKFGVNRRTMSRWVASGKVKSIVTPGGHHRIPREAIDDLLELGEGRTVSAVKKKSVLIVDDEALVLGMLEEELESEGVHVETATDGFKAGLKALFMKPDLIILDLMMEGIDGFEMCRTIKAHSGLKGCDVVILSGFDTPENRERAAREGALGFISKGDSMKSAVGSVLSLLEKRGGPA